jgi:hypothetical protein
LPLCTDLDGDGRADLALVEPGRSPGVTVLRSLGAALGPGRPLEVAAADAAAGDLDRDGDVDLLVAAADGDRLLFLRNLGDGNFAAPVDVSLAGRPARVLVTDLDADLWPDVVVAERDGTVAVLRNQGGGHLDRLAPIHSR